MGVNAFPISIEVDISNGLPGFSMVGLLSSEVKEARERVRTAIKNAGFAIPPKKITINLSPAELRKEGACFDLAIAVAILVSLGMVSAEIIEKSMFLGELSLDGSVNKINGVLGITLMAKQQGIQRVFVPHENTKEGALIKDIEVVGVRALNEVVKLLNNPLLIEPDFINEEEIISSPLYMEETRLDFSDLYGQDGAKRATEIAVAGMHNILYIGSPGSGKTMLARRIPSILPDLTINEAIEITKIYSAIGILPTKSIMGRHPFRAPHHTITPQALIGGGKTPKPGEITLAHKGILFLDELPEFNLKSLETLRQPLEEQQIIINRENASFTFPADFMMVAAMNSCPCGFYPDRHKCNCLPHEIERYMGKIKGALLDRIDLCIHTSKLKVEQLHNYTQNESSMIIKKRIEQARLIQHDRYKGTNISYNSRLPHSQMRRYCYLGENEKSLLSDCYKKIELSTRVYHKIIKTARTIADLDGVDTIKREHLIEAIGYRNIIMSI